ncbi:hypothetical protein SRB5_35140 [Streptomyces sp. RB5]|uniref:Zinc finger CGNR domain-containing protein n=1 Tax=Streptomyces smaragdinus TaxID=2585196 RepID=A0A7K0CIU0_9ACTN|nr:CGNR zinc finger domain-containing protein [Streptomyces smaragdinus]MQY13366.1 hypothetical protein [Streptomyces smaragdinus]
MFDSHVTVLLDASVALVNALTPGTARGKPYEVPSDLPGAVAAALPSVDAAEVQERSALYLARTADRLRTVFEAAAAGHVDTAAAEVNALLRDTGARPQLDRAPGEPWQLHFHGADDSLAVGWSAGCATGLALAVGSSLAGRLGVCAAGGCDRVYVDTSRNAGRQFCSTACQNRVKAAAFRARRLGA